MESGARRSSGTVAAMDATLIGSGSQSGVNDVAAEGAAREAGWGNARSPSDSVSSSTATPASGGESDGDGNVNRDGDGRAIADGNASLSAGSDAAFALADKISRLRWRTRSRNEGRALSRGRSPGCMHTAWAKQQSALNEWVAQGIGGLLLLTIESTHHRAHGPPKAEIAATETAKVDPQGVSLAAAFSAAMARLSEY
ncbi:hypothetical protein E4U14_001063 [Claviceps sp. LM454 group G7]|nr:hypothetical protein E4U14_001063 [Claviceps sp. LM454 group G7]